ncbi:hypothetical protein VNO78_16536 [Psophocarpus tetragonolobus]|uniref:TF-B3 domain-containing protein n=1 Tax=Psophocarpus tetragonolobus TaxID=3891 RepID=A0AAN9SGD5_PSOTE
MATGCSHKSDAKQIRFFKIITASNLHEEKLMIPIKFVRKYGEGLTNTVFLKTPNGAQWKLKLEKKDGKIWFQKGWREFAEYHSLVHGHLLIFRFETTSRFQVHIFDLSALEIDYPSKRTDDKVSSNIRGSKPPNQENLGKHRTSQKRKDKPSLEFLQRYKLRSRKRVKVDNTKILPKEAWHHPDTKCKGKSKAMDNQVTALERASSFESCNPFFLLVMHPSYIRHGTLNVPFTFGRTHLDLQKRRGPINLQVLNGRVWPANILIQKGKTITKFRFSGGWKAFSKHNNLKVDDVCIFELIKRTKLTFLVHIFRETKSSNCLTSKGRIDV